MTVTSPLAGVWPPLAAAVPAALPAAARPVPCAAAAAGGTGLVAPGFTAAPVTAADAPLAGLTASLVTNLDFTLPACCTSCHHF